VKPIIWSHAVKYLSGFYLQYNDRWVSFVFLGLNPAILYNCLLWIGVSNSSYTKSGFCGFSLKLYKRCVRPSLVIRDLPLVCPLIIKGLPAGQSRLGKVCRTASEKLLTTSCSAYPYFTFRLGYSTNSCTLKANIKGGVQPG
jgi:hypothetical protein